MADAVTTTIIRNSNELITVHLTNLSDGTGESAATKVTRTDYIGPLNANPSALGLLSCRWNVQGFSYVRLYWDRSPAETIMLLCGNGYEDFDSVGGFKTDKGTGGTGNLLLTTEGSYAGNTYDITLVLKKLK